MAATMQTVMLEAAGLLAVAAAIIHGVLGETRVFAHARIEPAGARRLLRVVWQAGAAAWAALGILLVAAPAMASPAAQFWIIAMAVPVFGFGAIANYWATRGRHFGWAVLGCVTVLALGGLA
jgi:hypothetical protein